jgi:hypothetical protein
MSDIETYTAEVINPMRAFSEVLCIRDYKGFIRNHVYAALGWNNGVHVVRDSERGDVLCLICLNVEDALVPMGEEEKAVFEYIKYRKEPK